jgi:AcrR family transcriptional regulator
MVIQKRAAMTRQALIRSAAEVFAETGYSAAALGTISRGAGVSAGALHFHFPSKLALAESVVREAATAMDRIRECALSESGDPIQQLIDGENGGAGSKTRYRAPRPPADSPPR